MVIGRARRRFAWGTVESMIPAAYLSFLFSFPLFSFLCFLSRWRLITLGASDPVLFWNGPRMQQTRLLRGWAEGSMVFGSWVGIYIRFCMHGRHAVSFFEALDSAVQHGWTGLDGMGLAFYRSQGLLSRIIGLLSHLGIFVLPWRVGIGAVWIGMGLA